MNKRKWLFRMAAFLTLFTCVGHTLGHFNPPPLESPQSQQVLESMKQAMVPFPMGVSRSFYEVEAGSSLCVSVFLLMTGLLLVILASSKSNESNHISRIISLGLAGVAAVSAVYFFPLPALCLGIAAVLTFVAAMS